MHEEHNTNEQHDVVDIARAYYDSSDADRFYATIWGGEDIHIGMYENEGDSIREASQRTVQFMAEMTLSTAQPQRVLDLGSGYGGAARYLAAKYPCHVTALNLSTVENNRNRMLNDAAGLSSRIDVIEGNFEELPFEAASFDVVWSQDAFLHSERRQRVVSEAARVLKTGGTLIFTDPMQSDACPDGVLQPILDRIHLSSLASPAFYRSVAEDAGLEFVHFFAFPHHLASHYQAVLTETTRREEELARMINPEYIRRMKTGLGHWIEGGKQGHLTWGIFRFGKTKGLNV